MLKMISSDYFVINNIVTLNEKYNNLNYKHKVYTEKDLNDMGAIIDTHEHEMEWDFIFGDYKYMLSNFGDKTHYLSTDFLYNKKEHFKTEDSFFTTYRGFQLFEKLPLFIFITQNMQSSFIYNSESGKIIPIKFEVDFNLLHNINFNSLNIDIAEDCLQFWGMTSEHLINNKLYHNLKKAYKIEKYIVEKMIEISKYNKDVPIGMFIEEFHDFMVKKDYYI